MIVQIAVADAYGAAFEFSKNPPRNDLKFHKHPTRNDDLVEGEYTDDTQMTLAIMRHLISDRPWNQYWISWFFLDEYRNYKIDGYARGFQKFISECRFVNDFVSKMSPLSNRNGSVMRSVPVGVLGNVEDVVNYSYIQSSATHATPSSCVSAASVALASHYYYHNLGPKNKVLEYIKAITGFTFRRITSRVACDAIETANAAIWISKSTDNIELAMKKAVDLGGDTDSVAAVACGLISMRQGINCDMVLADLLSVRNRRSLNNMIKLEEELFNKFERTVTN